MDFEFDQRIERAATLPARFYTDSEALAAEKRRIFNHTWQLVGRLDQVPEPGSFFTADAAGEPVLIARDKESRLRGFFNVCRHRAGPVASGAGCRGSFQCGYHGWTYALDGRLIGTPEFEGIEDFDRSRNGLVPIAVETWEQFIFVNARGGEVALGEFFGDIPSLTKAWNISRMKLVERRDYLIDCNWKVYVDNYLEGYHIPIVHPSLMRELDYTRYATKLGKYHSRQDAPIRETAGGDTSGRRYTSADEQTEAAYFWVFPNLMLNVYPDNVSTNLIIPVGTDKTLTVFEWFFHNPESESVREKIRRTVEFSDSIQLEDIRICEAVQRGLMSSSYDRGRYSPRRETGVHHFHSLYRDFVKKM